MVLASLLLVTLWCVRKENNSSVVLRISAQIKDEANKKSKLQFRLAQNATAHNSTILVWVVDFDPESEYIVIAEIPQKYICAAIQTTDNKSPRSLLGSDDDDAKQYIEFALQLPFAGIYNLRVQEIGPKATRRKELPIVVPYCDSSSCSAAVSTLSLSVSAEATAAAVTKPLPPCQSVPHDAPLLPWSGDWIGPDVPTLQQHTLRTGWSFAPSNCSLETFTSDELQTVSLSSHSNKITIAVLGTSRERGIFLSMVDMVLQGSEKDALQNSTVGKCWGRASVRLNSNLEFVYQDVRTQLCDPDEVPGTLTCHDDKLADASGYFEDTKAMVQELFDHPDPPQVILLWSGCYNSHAHLTRERMNVTNRPHKFFVASKEILASISPDWDGTLYLSMGFIEADALEVTADQLATYIDNLHLFTTFLDDARARVLDLYRLSADMKMASERVEKIHGSTHHHRWCNDNGMRVCSNVTEAMANLLIGRAVAPMGKSHWTTTTQQQPQIINYNIQEETHRQLQVCTDCPLSLLPMHVKVRPDLECTTGRFVETQSMGAAWNVAACPQDCLQTKPVGSGSTQSGPVPVRICAPNQTQYSMRVVYYTAVT